MPESDAVGGRTVLSRAFAILELFVAHPRALAMVEIRDATGFPLATTHRYLSELEQLGALERLPSGRYQLGTQMWRLGASSRWERLVRQTASPILQLLSEETGHAIALTALNGERLIVLDRRWGRSRGISLADTGEELPLLLTSAGKVLLAHDRRENVETIVTSVSNTVLHDDIIRKVDQARVAGYSIAVGELAGSQSSISVQVGPSRGDVTIALSLLTPTHDGSPERFAAQMKNSANLLSSALKSNLSTHGNPDHLESV